MMVSYNGGTPTSSMFMGFSILSHNKPSNFGYFDFRTPLINLTSICGNLQPVSLHLDFLGFQSLTISLQASAYKEQMQATTPVLKSKPPMSLFDLKLSTNAVPQKPSDLQAFFLFFPYQTAGSSGLALIPMYGHPPPAVKVSSKGRKVSHPGDEGLCTKMI